MGSPDPLSLKCQTIKADLGTRGKSERVLPGLYQIRGLSSRKNLPSTRDARTRLLPIVRGESLCVGCVFFLRAGEKRESMI